MPERIQRKRTAGWRMPEGAVYVGRPSRWGNPFPVDGEYALWFAVGTGHRGDAAGRRSAAVDGFRWIMGGRKPFAKRSQDGGAFEYADGRIVTAGEFVDGLGLMMLARMAPLEIPATPDLAPLRGRDLACWCPLVDANGDRVPCHADVLLELANR